MRTSLKTTLILAVAATAAFALFKLNKTAEVEAINPTIHQTFVKWTAKHGKKYDTPKEFAYRLSVFAQKLKRMTELQKTIDFKLALNKFSDLTKEEFKTKYTGLKISKAPRNIVTLDISNDPPASIDWRTKGIVNKVKDQGQCGSCWAFSAVAATEAAWAQAGNPLADFAEQQLVDCSSKQGNQGCNGGWMDQAFNYFKIAATELTSDYKYVARDQKCKADPTKYVAQMKSYVDVTPKNPAQLQAAAATTVVSIAIDASDDVFMDYDSGIITSQCYNDLDHGVAIVGYGSEGTKKPINFWIVRNSWGSDWGESGYVRIENTGSNDDGMCGINMAPSYVTGIAKYSP